MIFGGYLAGRFVEGTFQLWLGRFGIFTDITFKVFPQPRAYVTLTAGYANLEAALQAIYRLSVTPSRWMPWTLSWVPTPKPAC